MSCQLVGQAGAGKTQTCMTLAVVATLPRALGGIDDTSSVLYLDTENKFSPHRYQLVVTGCASTRCRRLCSRPASPATACLNSLRHATQTGTATRVSTRTRLKLALLHFYNAFAWCVFTHRRTCGNSTLVIQLRMPPRVLTTRPCMWVDCPPPDLTTWIAQSLRTT